MKRSLFLLFFLLPIIGCGSDSDETPDNQNDTNSIGTSDGGTDSDGDGDTDSIVAEDTESEDGGENNETDNEWTNLCLHWKHHSCEVFHDCGMMQGWPDCDAHAEESCASFTEPDTGCDAELTTQDLDDCLTNMREACMAPEPDLTFETIRDVPGCYSVDACLGWPI